MQNAEFKVKPGGSGSAPQKSETENADFTFLNIVPRGAQKLGQTAECE